MTHSRAPRRLLAALIGGSLAIVGTPSAFASHQSSTASVDVRDAVAGGTRPFSISVTHPSGTGDAINFVRVRPPGGSVSSGILIDPVSATGPSGWSAQVLTDDSIEFSSGAGSGIAPGQTAQFSVLADVSRPATDDCGEWSVGVSSQGGGALGAALPAVAGALRTCVRVLHVTSIALVSPGGAIDGSVTAGQSGICARMSLANLGSANLVVLPSPEGPNLGMGLVRAAAEPPCSGSELAEGKAPMEAGESRSFDVRITAGDASSTVLYGRATSPGVSAMEASSPITIQPQVNLNYANGTLIPRSVQPGTQGAVFRFTASKGPAGSPAATLHATPTTFAFAGCPARPLISPTDMLGGQVNNVVLEFDGCNIAQPQDGRYEVTVVYRYTDDNDFTATRVLNGVDRVRVDGTPPEVQPALDLPAAACCAPPAEVAVKNGDRVTLSGTVRDSDPDTGKSELCPGCFVQAEIRQYQEEGCEIVGPPPISVSPSNTAGSLGGVYQGSYATTTGSVKWFITARDEAGNTTVGSSACVPVDNVKPVILKAETSKVGADQDRLNVVLHECVGGTTNILDWRLDGNFIAEVVSSTCAVVDGAPRSTVVLRVVLPFPDDGPSGTLRYEPLPVAGGRLHDRVDNVMAAQEIQISDGIVPPVQRLW